jgi:hypothetical protein
MYFHNSLKKKFQNIKNSYTGASVVSWVVLTGLKMVSSMVCREDSASENLQAIQQLQLLSLNKTPKTL